jgi:acyl-CoA synthetase (AMP-forming)/AMP-acid ligase II
MGPIPSILQSMSNLIFCGCLPNITSLKYRFGWYSCHSKKSDFESKIKNLFLTNIPDKILGNCLVALFFGKNLNEIKLKAFFKKNYPSFMCPKEILSINSIPVSENGKVSNKSIRDYYERIKM